MIRRYKRMALWHPWSVGLITVDVAWPRCWMRPRVATTNEVMREFRKDLATMSRELSQ